MMTYDEKRIKEILKSGNEIRRIDGRWMGGFVNRTALEGLITAKRVEVYVPTNANNLEFVRRKPTKAEADNADQN